MSRAGSSGAPVAPRDGAAPPSRERLVFLALAVLDDVIEQSAAGRVPPSSALRLALAYLYANGERRGEWFDRQPYIEFWQEATQRDEAGTGAHAGAGAWARRTAMRANMEAIARAAKMPITVELMEAWRRTRPI